MRKVVKAKLEQAEAQAILWQQKLTEAQEQCIRWNAISRVCQELLATDVPIAPVEDVGSLPE